ncbi:uncharacterized protein LOC109281456 [Alligator mississippiensis]|uniref:uncharacterized protein LOC109281456 n=1 Tax=Alligator mississippiensis TaxID=8496 RepID=UPI0028775334|nr:uncharacterized protein LOC109281456 [Alligator mississippiensis]
MMHWGEEGRGVPRDELLHNLGATLWKVNSGLDPNEAVTAPKISPPNAWGNLAIDQINHQKETPSPSLGNKKTASYSFSMCHGKSLLGWGYLVGHQMLGRWAAPKICIYTAASLLYRTPITDLQAIIHVFTEACKKMGLMFNIQKTKFLHQQALNEQSPAPVIQIHGETLENIEYFPYLRSQLSQKAEMDEEIQRHLKYASAAFGCQRKQVFEDHDIRSETKLMAHAAVMIPT